MKGMNTLPPPAEMRAAYLRRDPAYDGLFLVAVRTTSIFCRPVCPARSPRPENVEFFRSASEAVFAGYRPCKRCRPMATADQPEWLTALLAHVEADPVGRITEKGLQAFGVDPATVRRYFVRYYGMTFQAYTRARRLGVAFNSIRGGTSLDAAAFASGYESLSGFREAFGQSIGCTPGVSREHKCVFLAWLPSPLGPLVAGATDAGVCLLDYTDRRTLKTQFASLTKAFRATVLPGVHPHLDLLRAELAEYFAGRRRTFSVPVVYPGTPFQQRVWGQLLRIPYGETRSYRDLAVAVGDRAAVRAVGRANGLNRINILIPCHRVVNANGDLGGYGGGLRRKQFLLNLEQVNVESSG